MLIMFRTASNTSGGPLFRPIYLFSIPSMLIPLSINLFLISLPSEPLSPLNLFLQYGSALVVSRSLLLISFIFMKQTQCLIYLYLEYEY